MKSDQEYAETVSEAGPCQLHCCSAFFRAQHLLGAEDLQSVQDLLEKAARGVGFMFRHFGFLNLA